MPSSRDDFTKDTIMKAAGRVGFRCSFPGCKHVTIGPSMESDSKVSNIGVGAHICAAAEGGPRYDPNMSSSERKHISNCIWLCQTHAHLIDTDTVKYSVDTLRKWKTDAEVEASLALERAESFADFYSLSENSVIEFERLFEYLVVEGQYQQLYTKLQQFQRSQLSPAFHELVLRYTIHFDAFCRHNRIAEDLSCYLAQEDRSGANDLARLFISFMMPDQYGMIKELIDNENIIKASEIVFAENCAGILFDNECASISSAPGEEDTLTKARLYYLYKCNGIAPPETLNRLFLEIKQGFFYRVLFSIGKVLSLLAFERTSPSEVQENEDFGYLCACINGIAALDVQFQEYIWKYILAFCAGSTTIFNETYSKCPDGIKTKPSIERVRLQHAISTAPHEQDIDYLLRFSEEINCYDLILRYLSFVDPKEAAVFLDEHRFLLRRDANILFFRLFILGDLSHEQRRTMLEAYGSDYSSSFLYHCMVANECENEERLESELVYLETHPQFGTQEAELYIKVLNKHKKWDKLAALSNQLFPYDLQYYIAKALSNSDQETHLKTAVDIFAHLYNIGWHREGFKNDYAYVLNRAGRAEASKKLLQEEYDEFSGLSALQGLINLRLVTNECIEDKYFHFLCSCYDAKSLYLTGEVFLKKRKYQQAYDCFLRSLLVDKHFLHSCFGIFQISIQNKLPPKMKYSRDDKLIVIKNDQETRKIAIHSTYVLQGITPTTFAGCEHYSIEDPAVSRLVFSNVTDNVSFDNKQYVVEEISSLQDEMVRKCYEVVLNDPNVTRIKGETAEDFIRAIKPILQSSNEAITSVLADYNNAPLQMPLTSLANATGKSMLEISEFLMFGNKAKIRNNLNDACFDTADATPSFVFTYDAIIHLFELGLPLPGKVNEIKLCPVQVRNHLIKDIDDDMGDMLSDNHPGSMVFINGELTIMKYTQATRQERYLHLSKLKDFLNQIDSPNNSYDYQSRDDEIGAKLAEIVLGNNLFCESGSLGLAQNLDNVIVVTDDQMLYSTAEYSGIKTCGITGFLAASEYTWEQLLNASKRLKKMNYANYLPFHLYKAIVDAMLAEGEEDIEQKSATIQEWICSGGNGEPTEQHKDIIIDLLRNTVQSKLVYLNPGFFLSELAAPIIEERNPGMLQQLWEKVLSSLPQKLHELIDVSLDPELS